MRQIELTKEQKTLLNHSTLRGIKNGDKITVLRGENKGFTGIIKMISYQGGDEWVKIELYNSRKKKTITVEVPEIYTLKSQKEIINGK